MRDLEFGNEERLPTDVQKVIKLWIEQQSQGMRVTAEERTTVRMRRNINATPWGRYLDLSESAEERARIEIDLL